jgi:hypothetical protein
MLALLRSTESRDLLIIGARVLSAEKEKSMTADRFTFRAYV